MKDMLDDLKFIHQRDGQDALGVAGKQWQQLQQDFQFTAEDTYSTCENIVFAGMGGSALAALIARSWPATKIPFEICRQYNIPKYVSDKTLFIASSYSGNTEETLAALNEAENRRAKIIILASGGKLAEIAKEKSYPMLLLPQIGQPRYAVLYSLKAFVTILESLGLAASNNAKDALAKTADFLKENISKWDVAIPTKENLAKNMAEELAGKSIVIYAGPMLSPAAYKWKINFNENAKNVAWWNEFPEFNHNEFIGWSSHPIQKVYGIVELRSNLEHERVQKRFDLSNRLLSGKKPEPIKVAAKGQSLIEQLLYSVALGDFVSIYMALLNNVNPTPVDLVEKFKTELNK